MKRPIGFENFEALQGKDLQKQMTSLQQERDFAAQNLQMKDQQLQALSAEKGEALKSIVAKDKQINDLSREKVAIAQQLTERENLLSQKDQQMARIQAERDSSLQRLTQKDQQINALAAEVNVLKQGDGARAALMAEKVQLTTHIGSLEKNVREKDSLIASHLAEIERLRAQPKTAPGAPAAPVQVAMSDIMTSIGAQVADAKAKLATDNNFGIGNIAVTLKTRVDPENGAFRIFDPRDKISADLMDTISFDINTGGSTGAGPTKERVPDLSGMTHGAATRLLGAIGLRLDAATGIAPKSSNFSSGQAFRQAPAAGEPVDRGTVVLAIFQQ